MINWLDKNGLLPVINMITHIEQHNGWPTRCVNEENHIGNIGYVAMRGTVDAYGPIFQYACLKMIRSSMSVLCTQCPFAFLLRISAADKHRICLLLSSIGMWRRNLQHVLSIQNKLNIHIRRNRLACSPNSIVFQENSFKRKTFSSFMVWSD